MPPPGEAQEDLDRVVEARRGSARQREEAARRCRLHRLDRAGDGDLEVDVVARELEQDAAAAARIGEPLGPALEVAPGGLGRAVAAADEHPGEVTRSSACSSASTSSERHW